MIISLPVVLSRMETGDRYYLETSLKQQTTKAMTVTSTISRVKLPGRKFATTRFTAVGAQPGDIRYLVCVERTE
jgi:hypothetical protein